MNVIVPIEQTEATVTLARSDYEALIERLEDAIDSAAVDRSNARRAALGEDEYRRLCYTAAEVHRMLFDDVSRVTIWRERAELTQDALARAANISRSYLAEIEGRKKPGSAAALRAIAAVLKVPMEHLMPGDSGIKVGSP